MSQCRHLVLVLAFALSASTAAQTPDAAPPAFEAVSVKENASDRVPMQWQGARFVASGLPLQSLIIVAYEVPMYELAGLPDWVRTVRYQVNALASRAPAPAEQRSFLRALLVERFGIATRTVTEDRPVHRLVLARPDGRLGPGLRTATLDCAAALTARAAGGDPQGAASAACTTIAVGRGVYIRNGIGLASLTDVLTTNLERPVLDHTGLTGLFDIELRFRPLGGTVAPDAEALPDLLTAVQEQLGLKLEPARAPVSRTVFDRVERPSPN